VGRRHRLSNPTSHLLSFFRLIAYFVFTVSLMPVQALAIRTSPRLRVALPMFYHRIAARILGFRLQVQGRVSTDASTLFVSNHCSYIDIEMFGAVIPGSFVAKSEVKKWPLFGWLARLQRTVFVDRRVRSSAEQRDSLTARLQAGDNLILFPEGTSNDGTHVRQFKSALFAAAEVRVDGRHVTVQPVSLAYTRLNGMPMGRDMRPRFAWYGDMEMAAHLWQMVGFGIVDVVVEFHPPVTIDGFGSRKKLAEHCERVIAQAVAAANAGRRAPLVEHAAANTAEPVRTEAVMIS
jgi:1-acyl-sn-glycerol-3-phosphate acyltransferase